MKKKMIRFIAWAMVVATLAISFAACGESGTAEESKSGASTSASSNDPAAVVTEEETTVKLDDYGREWIDADIPEANYGGYEFHVHTRGNVEQYEWKADDLNGTTLNDAIYRRNTAVEELLGVKIVTIAEGSWANYDSELLPKIKASITANDGAYDLLAGYGNVTSLATAGLLLNLNDLQYIDFDKPWWSSSFNENTGINGKNYLAVGSLSLSMIYSMECIIFNTDILSSTAGNSYNIYQTVKDGKWTLEEVETLSKQAWDDKNSNGVADKGDIVGFSMEDVENLVLGIFVGCGANLTTFTDNTPSFDNINTTKINDIIEAVNTLFWSSDGVASTATSSIAFGSGEALFNFRWLYWVQTKYAGEMDDYGIVPLPKLNTEQENYYTNVQAGMHMYCIPNDVSDKNQTSIITEALAAESYRSLVPAYYEVVLKTRYSQDAETSQMLDMMYDTVVFDFSYIWKNEVSYINSIINMMKNNSNSFSSSYKTLAKAAATQLKKLIETIDSLN